MDRLALRGADCPGLGLMVLGAWLPQAAGEGSGISPLDHMPFFLLPGGPGGCAAPGTPVLRSRAILGPS